ncbi:GSCFA domain-containing protein [Cereibacter sphaeroides]|nr:GSCFA domain-containing protein [Cereibacter sphaeroides]
MTDHPYQSLPNKAFWRRSVARPAMAEVDPVGSFTLKIEPETKVATAGSCFAQHVARHLKGAGFNYYVVEEGHPILPASIRAAHNYGTFSARYGNIYTARQLRQLIERAYGRFTPVEAPWVEADGVVKDPFRPNVQPGGYVSVAEMELDRKQHLAAVRQMFETLDVFVFTLGLTECWESLEDGAVFPLCPGVEGGKFDPTKYAFLNQSVPEVVEDMNAFIAALKAVNPEAQMIVTVSPVPLMATATPEQHVLTATTYSKSVLRVAADMLTNQHDFVHYFPSYEIITGPHARGAYYADDLRNVTEAGVNHVMRLLLKYATGKIVEAPVDEAPSPKKAKRQEKPAPIAKDDDSDEDDTMAMARAFVEVECDEVALDRPARD